MKNYNVKNYIRYKQDVKQANSGLEGLMWGEYSRDDIIIKNMPMVETIARKFNTAQQASGVLNLEDLIQEGNKGLVQGVDRLNWDILNESNDIEASIKSFLSKRIKGAIRRSIDINRGSIKIPEYKLIEIRKDNGKDEKLTNLFFNSIFDSLDKSIEQDEEFNDPPDKTSDYNLELLSSYLLSLINKFLNKDEAEILRLFYGLNTDRMQAKDIAKLLNFESKNAFVRISQIKKKAIDKLSENVNYSQVVDYL
jgi:RNA polymerase sigma factor (sigma-70 family)